MSKGQIIKIESNNYTVYSDNTNYICKPRGIFRKLKITPLVGDKVEFDKEKLLIEEVLSRKNEFYRPKVANVDQAIIVTSVKIPLFSLNLLDKLLILMELKSVKPIICITKADLLEKKELEEVEKILNYYKKIGYKVLFNTEIDKIKEVLKNRVSVFVGQTGAGKSTLLNRLEPSFNLKVGEVSVALGRGRHTTRVVEMFDVAGGKVFDTPGFSALEFNDFDNNDIKNAFIEFKNYPCVYKDCMHTLEKECNVKKAVDDNKILKSRYDNYLSFIARR